MPHIEVMHWISESALALMGIIVSTVAAQFNYREQFGWSPILLVTAQGTGVRLLSKQRHYASISFEFWNRRTYPVVIRDATVRILGSEMPYWGGKDGDHYFMPSENWSWSSDGARYTGVARLEPSSALAFETEIPFREGYLGHAKFDWRIDVLCFDPISNKSITYKLVSKFSMESVLHGVKGETVIDTE